MTILYTFGICLAIGLLVAGLLILQRGLSDILDRMSVQNVAQLQHGKTLHSLDGAIRDFATKLEQVPAKVLGTFEGSTNTMKGNVGEWAAWQQLLASYDIVIPFNRVFDYIGIRFDRPDDPGVVEFLEIKTGKARLSEEQRKLKELLERGNVSFRTIRMKVS